MKINIISGFLGAGKTTFLNKIIPLCGTPEKPFCEISNDVSSADKRENAEHAYYAAVIENELGSAAIDGDLLNGGLPVLEISSGCVCCGLAGTLIDTIAEVRERFNPDVVFIEPSGVGMLTDVVSVCEQARFKAGDDVSLGCCVTIVDASCWFDFSESFGAFYTDQVRRADAIFFSRLDDLSAAERERLFADIAEINRSALIYSQDWFNSDGAELLAVLESAADHVCTENCEYCEKFHDDRAESMSCCEHQHDHEHGHEHHHGLLTSLSAKDIPPLDDAEVDAIIAALRGSPGKNHRSGEFGDIVRAKGILKLKSGGFVRFDAAGKHTSREIFAGADDTVARAVIIGRNLDGASAARLFGVLEMSAGDSRSGTPEKPLSGAD